MRWDFLCSIRRRGRLFLCNRCRIEIYPLQCLSFSSGPVKFKMWPWLGSYLTQKVSDAGLCRSGPSSPPPLFKMWFWRVSDVELGRSGLSSPSPPPPPPPTLGFASKTWSRHWKWLLQGFSLQSWKCELPLSFALTRRQYVCRVKKCDGQRDGHVPLNLSFVFLDCKPNICKQ